MLCPECRTGRIFRGWITSHESCPSCGVVFEKEPGYFVGAMYFSYALSVPSYALFVLAILKLWPQVSLPAACVAALPPFLALVPLIYRYSRVLWLHFDFAIRKGR
jgi:uncharacterized protein (DUF983 family)